MRKALHHERVPLTRFRFRLLSIIVISLNCASVVVAFILIAIAAHERARFMEYFRLIPDSSRGVGHATALITVCATTSLASPFIFFLTFVALPRWLHRREEAELKRAKSARKVSGEVEEEGVGDGEREAWEEKEGLLPAALHASEARARTPRLPARPSPHADQSTSSALEVVQRPVLAGDDLTTHACVPADTGGRFYVHPPFSHESTSEDERTARGGRGTAKKAPATTTTTNAMMTTTTTMTANGRARHTSMELDPLGCTPPPQTATATESSCLSLLSPNPPHRTSQLSHRSPPRRTHKGSVSTLAPPSLVAEVDSPSSGRNPLQPLTASLTHAAARNDEDDEDDEEEPLSAHAKAEARLRAATCYARYLVSSTLFRVLIWIYFLSGFVCLIIIFACGTFGALSTAFASLNTGKDMELGWVVAFVSHLDSDGLAPSFSSRLCHLQIAGRCSGGTVLCNATTVESERTAQSNFCPVCAPDQQRRINGFTELCSSRYYVGKHYPVVYFALVAVAAVLLTACFVLVIVVDDLGIMPSASYACNLTMAHVRSTTDWARAVALDNFVTANRDAPDGYTLSTCAAAEDLLRSPPPQPGPATGTRGAAALATTTTITTVGVTTSTVDTLHADHLGASGHMTQSTEPRTVPTEVRRQHAAPSPPHRHPEPPQPPSHELASCHNTANAVHGSVFVSSATAPPVATVRVASSAGSNPATGLAWADAELTGSSTGSGVVLSDRASIEMLPEVARPPASVATPLTAPTRQPPSARSTRTRSRTHTKSSR